MMPRRSAKRKFNPGFEDLGHKQLPSTALPAGVLQAPDPATAQVSTPADPPDDAASGTGGWIRIPVS
jgi:hypothetical protein